MYPSGWHWEWAWHCFKSNPCHHEMLIKYLRCAETKGKFCFLKAIYRLGGCSLLKCALSRSKKVDYKCKNHRMRESVARSRLEAFKQSQLCLLAGFRWSVGGQLENFQLQSILAQKARTSLACPKGGPVTPLHFFWEYRIYAHSLIQLWLPASVLMPGWQHQPIWGVCQLQWGRHGRASSPMEPAGTGNRWPKQEHHAYQSGTVGTRAPGHSCNHPAVAPDPNIPVLLGAQEAPCPHMLRSACSCSLTSSHSLYLLQGRAKSWPSPGAVATWSGVCILGVVLTRQPHAALTPSRFGASLSTGGSPGGWRQRSVGLKMPHWCWQPGHCGQHVNGCGGQTGS